MKAQHKVINSLQVSRDSNILGAFRALGMVLTFIPESYFTCCPEIYRLQNIRGLEL